MLTEMLKHYRNIAKCDLNTTKQNKQCKNYKKTPFTLFPVKITSSQSDFMLKCSNFMFLFLIRSDKQFMSRPNRSVCNLLVAAEKETFVKNLFTV